MTKTFTRLGAAGLAALTLTAVAGVAWAWGASGHRIIGRVAVRALPADLPAFLKTSEAVDAIGEIAREPDRSRGAGQPHDADLDPGHFVDLTEDGHVFIAGGPSLAAMPRNRNDYDIALVKAGVDPFKAGYLQYNVMDGYQQLTKDFAHWRAESAALKRGLLAPHRDWVVADVRRREALIIRDLGYWAHFVGDGSQPFHVSIHYNGWGDYPNPEGFTQDKVHGPFEGDFVIAHVKEADVAREMPPLADCGASIQACTASYLTATQAQVVPFFRLYKAGAFASASSEAKAYTLARVTAGAAMLRDLVVRSWRESGKGVVGYKPSVSVAALESGAPADEKALWSGLYGDD